MNQGQAEGADMQHRDYTSFASGRVSLPPEAYPQLVGGAEDDVAVQPAAWSGFGWRDGLEDMTRAGFAALIVSITLMGGALGAGLYLAFAGWVACGAVRAFGAG
jgi:hypothetical protein